MQHKNFCESDALNVMTIDMANGKLISLGQIAGSVSFSFAMNPAQARELAADLVKQADEAEGVTQSTKADVTELLEALKEYVNASKRDGTTVSGTYFKACAAIAKAEGNT